MRCAQQWLIIAILSAITMPTAVAIEHGHGPHHERPEFADIDLDGNGLIEEAEFYEARGKRIAKRSSEGRALKNLANAPAFADIDSDGNGTVNKEEFATHQTQRRAQKKQERKL